MMANPTNIKAVLRQNGFETSGMAMLVDAAAAGIDMVRCGNAANKISGGAAGGKWNHN